MPRFSIIVGIYNQSGTLPMLIQSLNEQTFKDFEVHFCDDGSDDADVKYAIMSTIDATIPWYYHRQEHKGMRLARNVNQGIRAAAGEHCVFVMADSFFEQDYLEILNEYADDNRLVCGIRVQLAPNAEGKLEGVDMDWRVKKNVVPQFASVITRAPWSCFTGNGLTIPTAAMREYGGWDESLEGYGGDDTEIVARLYFKGYICWHNPDLRVYHHWHIAQETNPESKKHVLAKLEQYVR